MNEPKGKLRDQRSGGKAPLALFVASLALAAFAGGVWAGHYKAFPFHAIRSAYRTLNHLAFSLYSPDRPRGLMWTWQPTAFPLDRLDTRRVRLAGGALADPILLAGGEGHFVEHCPGHAGCIAVEYAGRGEVRRVWPYRPEEIARAAHPDDLPYELRYGFSFIKDAMVIAMSPYPNGDLLVVFHMESFPYAGGVARLDRDGRPVWYRRDYSHHRLRLTADGDALVPGKRISAGPMEFGPYYRRNSAAAFFELNCPHSPILMDVVRVIDGAGRVQEEFSVLDAVLESLQVRRILRRTGGDGCNLLHLNSIDVLGEDAGGADGLVPGDLVVSLRNVHAFAVLDRRTHRVKRLVRGDFLDQHAVLHLEGSRFLMFDNLGMDNLGMDAADGAGFSRLLVVDVADGSETTIFPNDATPDHLRQAFFTRLGGDVDLSPDRRRAIATAWLSGQGVEIRLADGAVLAEFDNVHDVSRLERLPDERMTHAWRFSLSGIRYVPREH